MKSAVTLLLLSSGVFGLPPVQHKHTENQKTLKELVKELRHIQNQAQLVINSSIRTQTFQDLISIKSFLLM
ncbi:hypothetical protein DPEC_G00289300 [Dallia pectoralis]|uniref:Uncharacterized protein n=1 Tax=Dallia pectoralis TaxID=75939 RepID=A0ACC2FKU2_DALPE|nr:hypothetical protein DPEC_G00289300 [Dallia pectoralis]